jgi:hypothetical protein
MNFAARILIWIAVAAWGFWLGGLLYEMVVIMPLWSANLPNSVIEWNSRPNFVMNPTRFYIPTVLTLILSSLSATILNWKSRNQRLWLILSTACVITAFVFTLIYFFPKNDVLFRNQGAGLSGEEITAIAHAWINANYIRFGIMIAGFFAALKAFSQKHVV